MGSNPIRGSSFLKKSDCLGCAVLLCLVVCLTLLASFFLPSSSLINIYFPSQGTIPELFEGQMEVYREKLTDYSVSLFYINTLSLLQSYIRCNHVDYESARYMYKLSNFLGEGEPPS